MKKHLGIFLLLATLIACTGCSNTNTRTSEASTLNDCKKGCDIISNDTLKKEDCYTLCETSQKLESNDVNDCDKIDETSGSFITKDICIQDKAIQAKKPEYCEKISDATMKDTCYMGLAGEMKDKTLCENVKEDIFKSTCLSKE